MALSIWRIRAKNSLTHPEGMLIKEYIVREYDQPNERRNETEHLEAQNTEAGRLRLIFDVHSSYTQSEGSRHERIRH